ncbi:AraC family transcriptional regulator [Dasania sp. GY-19]|uniref:AraC family transcriptional regulator n=1 Tax=Dasania phycosphaerae TaxID=2950436 RepID=A0A9J6RRV7_9GAMM|nr:AraC family transcriptional regulator [Dasania phycosphaerae]MCZ0866813.1 AraC family transcriptional regulator [Dasania phycosphaerae]
MPSIRLMRQPWTGAVAITTGMGVFVGISGDNKPHKHWAHQIAIGTEGHIELLSDKTRYLEGGVWIPAGTAHQLKTASVLCVYIDPTYDLCKTLLPQRVSQNRSIVVLDEEMSSKYMTRFAQVSDLQAALLSFNQQCRCHSDSAQDGRLSVILEALKNDVTIGGNTSQKSLSGLVHLSPSRFSHWFVEQTGMPLRSYRKWLRLLVGFELSQRMSLTDAAIVAGFSDQAHFCRTVTQAFGVSSTTIKQLLSHK